MTEFDSDEAKEFLLKREKKEQEEREKIRKKILRDVTALLKEEFDRSSVEVYLVGSILKPFKFSSHSDIDIVLKNYKGDRFDFWTKFEKKIGRTIEVIPFETCPFQEFVIKEGFKVV